MVTVESVLQTIDAMERFFRRGSGWGKLALHNPFTGKKCLMGAVGSVHATDGNRSWVPHEAIAAATECMRQAVREHGYEAVETFNDTRSSYSEIAALMQRARQIAFMRYAWQLPPPPSSPVPQIPAARPALTYQPQEELPVITLTLADLERVAAPRRK